MSSPPATSISIGTDAVSGLADARAEADPRLQGLRRLRATLVPYGLGMAGALAAGLAGLAQMWQAWTLVAYTASGFAVFFWLIHSGATRRWRDPMLVFPQVLFGIGLVSLAYALMDVARSISLEWLCLIIVFDMRRLAWRQTLIAGALSMALPVVGLLSTWQADAGGQGRLADKLIFLGLGAVLVPILMAWSSIARKVQVHRTRQREQMRSVLAQLRQLSVRDGLSGLFNRRHMQERLDEEVRRQRRTGRPFTVAILDIDLFKRVNDQYGHAVGDAVIRAFAALGSAAFDRDTDVLARWGGEEFLLLLPETPLAVAQGRLQRLRELVHAYDWSVHQAGLKVTFSGGACEHVAEHDLARTLEAADQALYRAKESGRDRILPSHAPQQADTAAAGAVAAALEGAAAMLSRRGQSPQSSVPAGQESGQEARRARPMSPLARWLFGADPSLHPILRSCLISTGNYLVLTVVLVSYGIPSGLVPVGLATFFLAVMAAGGIVPFVLVRTGATARLADRSITVPQIGWAAMALAVVFVALPPGRAFALQMMCMMLVISFVDTRPHQAIQVGLLCVGALVAGYLWLLVWPEPGFDPARAGLEVAASAYVLSLLALQSRNFARMREQSRQERQELAAATKQVFELMTRDALTGLFNRQHLQSLLERECARHDEAGHAFSVALIDLDHFKRINDGHGHNVGDEVLSGFARSACSFVRETDVVGRWGGEEFLLILPETETPPQGLCAVQRLREHVAARRLSATVPELAVTFSAGVATRERGEGLVHLLERADQALYRAKESGRNACVVA